MEKSLLQMADVFAHNGRKAAAIQRTVTVTVYKQNFTRETKFLACARYNLHRLPRKWKICQ